MHAYHFFCFLFSPLLVLQLAFAATDKALKTSSFSAHEVVWMNSFKNTHHLFNTALKSKDINPNLAAVFKKQIAKKSIALPEFQLTTDGGVLFKFENKMHELKREAGNQFRLNGKLVDLNAQDWSTEALYKVVPIMGLPFVIETADAVAPLAVVVVAAVIVILGGVVCSAPDIKISGAKTISLGRTQAERAISEMIRDAKRQMCSAGCDIACASPKDETFDHMKYLDDLCKDAKKYYVDLAEVERRSQELERVVNARQVRRTQLMANIHKLHTRHSQNLTLNELDQQILTGLVSDPDIMKWCVARYFPDPNSNIPSEKKAPPVAQ